MDQATKKFQKYTSAAIHPRSSGNAEKILYAIRVNGDHYIWLNPKKLDRQGKD
jgi:hypothetical protein